MIYIYCSDPLENRRQQIKLTMSLDNAKKFNQKYKNYQRKTSLKSFDAKFSHIGQEGSIEFAKFGKNCKFNKNTNEFELVDEIDMSNVLHNNYQYIDQANYMACIYNGINIIVKINPKNIIWFTKDKERFIPLKNINKNPIPNEGRHNRTQGFVAFGILWIVRTSHGASGKINNAHMYKHYIDKNIILEDNMLIAQEDPNNLILSSSNSLDSQSLTPPSQSLTPPDSNELNSNLSSDLKSKKFFLSLRLLLIFIVGCFIIVSIWIVYKKNASQKVNLKT